MLGIIIAFLTSFVVTLFIIRFKHLHERFSADSDLDGPQKFHKTAVPRIGGISIILGLLSAILTKTFDLGIGYQGTILLSCAIPTFVIGLTEDLTKKISVRQRLLFTSVSAAFFIYALDRQITSLGLPFMDLLFSIPFFGVLLTIFAITGLANAYNIIDGFNGLSSMVGSITLLALGYVAYTLNDTTLIFLSLVMTASILGFFIWNYPQGLIFLGDGGAYLIGFWIACLSIWLCFKHTEISPWFALLVNGYPIMETIFSIYRRKIHQHKNLGAPDGIHFHTLVYRRILRTLHFDNAYSANARTAPYLWLLAGLSVAPAVLWSRSTPIMMGACGLFAAFYIWVYGRIVRFRTPVWMRP